MSNSDNRASPLRKISGRGKEKAGMRSVRTAVGSQKGLVLLPYIRLGNIVKALVMKITLVMVLSLVVLHHHAFVS